MDIFLGKETHLSNLLKSKSKKQLFISLREKIEKKSIDYINERKKKNIFIIGGYPTKELKNLEFNKFNQFFELNFFKIFRILSLLNKKKINKILYFSSASVSSIEEGNIKKYNDKKKIYSLSKNVSELFLINFCKKNNITLNIFRIHNLYHDLDEHSFINILRQKKNKFSVENFDDVRDFIHIKDASNLIKSIVNLKTKKLEYFDIGTGKGYRIEDLLSYLGINKNKVNEIKIRSPLVSIANLSYLSDKKIKYSPRPVEKFLNINSKYKKIKKIRFINANLKKIIENKALFQNSTVIYGCGNAGKQIFNLLKNQNEEIKLFVDDDYNKNKTHFISKPVVSFDDFLVLNKYLSFKKIVLAIPSLNKNQFNDITIKLKKESIYFENVPLSKNKDQILKIEDLSSSIFENILKRKELFVDLSKFNFLNNKCVLITGGAGSIGGNLSALILKTKVKKIIVYDNSELNIYNLQSKLNFRDTKLDYILGDINDNSKLTSIVKKYSISHIFHAAANKHVNITEKNPLETIKNNILGTLNVLKISKLFKLHLTIISTDKAARPKSLLGYTKRFSELLNIVINHQKVNILRFGNVIASTGSALPRWVSQVNNDEQITITSKKAERFFMTINEACYLVLKTCKLKQKNKIYVLNMGKKIKILKIVNEIINLKKKLNPFYKPQIKYTGLQKGEKEVEVLSFNNKLKKTNIANIYSVNEPIYNRKVINNTIQNLENFIAGGSDKKAIKLLKIFFKAET